MTTDVRTTEATTPHRPSTPPATGRRTPMTRSRKLALVAGVAYLLTFVFSIPTLGMKAPLDNADFILGAGSTTGGVTVPGRPAGLGRNDALAVSAGVNSRAGR